MNSVNEREQFEAACGDETQFPKISMDISDLQSALVEIAWRAWQARAALASQPAPSQKLTDKEILHMWDGRAYRSAQDYIIIRFARAIEATALANQQAGAVPEGQALVSIEFLRDFHTLAHNYSLKAEAPDYYHGVERDAFSNAYRRCGEDLAKLRSMLACVPPAAQPAEPKFCKGDPGECSFNGACMYSCAQQPEAQGGTCPTCGSDCNERDELEKAEREIERLQGLFAASQSASEPVAQHIATVWFDGGEAEDIEVMPFAKLPDGSHKLYTTPQPPHSAVPEDVARDAERLHSIYLGVTLDGYGYWLPEWCVMQGETPPTFNEFRNRIDFERAAIDAAIRQAAPSATDGEGEP